MKRIEVSDGKRESKGRAVPDLLSSLVSVMLPAPLKATEPTD